MLARAFRLAAGDGLRGVVAFSDPLPRRTASGQLLMPGHIGHIYRAGAGATGRYTGRGTPHTDDPHRRTGVLGPYPREDHQLGSGRPVRRLRTRTAGCPST